MTRHAAPRRAAPAFRARIVSRDFSADLRIPWPNFDFRDSGGRRRVRRERGSYNPYNAYTFSSIGGQRVELAACGHSVIVAVVVVVVVVAAIVVIVVIERRSSFAKLLHVM